MNVLRLDPETRDLHFRAQSLRLTKIEFAILTQLLNGDGGFVARQELLRLVWGPKVSVEARTVDSHVVRLRRKVLQLAGLEGPTIETVWGLGYRIKYSGEFAFS
jgi:DNA-binding response OmpR family regulator